MLIEKLILIIFIEIKEIEILFFFESFFNLNGCWVIVKKDIMLMKGESN